MDNKEEIKSSAIKGSAIVTLYDAKTGKVVDEVKKENYITFWTYREFVNAITTAILSSNSVFSKPSANMPLKRIILTSSANPADEDVPILGNMVGWADRTLYSGSDTLRGSMNQAESYVASQGDTYLIHYVFDWPTHAGNGVFQTILWNVGNKEYNSMDLPLFLSPFIYDGSSSGVAVGGVAVNSERQMFYSGYEGYRLYKVQLDENYTNGILLSYKDVPNKIADITWDWDQQCLWASHPDNKKIASYTSDLDYISDFNVPFSPIGIVWVNGNIYVSDTTNKIYCVNPLTGDYTFFCNSPVPSQYLTWDYKGQIWTGEGNTATALNIKTGAPVTSWVWVETMSLEFIPPTAPGIENIRIIERNLQYNRFYLLTPPRYGARLLLPRPVEKTSNNTMKITYEFMIKLGG